jgi:hypothetical protein
MTDEATVSILDSTWMAVKKGDKDVAGKYLKRLGYELFMGEVLDRTDRLRLGWALMQLKSDPVAFFGYARSGPSSTKTPEKLEVWTEVRIEKERLREVGETQVDAFANIAEKLNFSPDKVKKDYEEVQNFIKQQDLEYITFSKGIASLIK